MSTLTVSAGPAPAWCLWRNPILRRFLRTRLRTRALFASLLLALVATGFIFFLPRSFGMGQIARAEEILAAGGDITNMYVPSLRSVERGCLIPLGALQAFILFIIGTGQAAGGMTADAEEGTMDYLRLSPMTPLSKVLGYLFGLPVREWAMFAITLPFTIWGIWRGEVPAENWIPVYAVMLVAAVLYHITALTAGTVLRNRRWAFLVSMGGVFVLYTIIPQLANLGLVYFEYLTILPVVMENLSGFLPDSAGSMIKIGQRLSEDVRFFGLGLPEAVFTIFSQLVLCVTFGVMLWRRWRKSESHLLGKTWATGLSAWIQVVLLGCSLPLISSGLLFISRRFSLRFNNRMFNPNGEGWSPALGEAVTMISIYGTVTLLSIIVLALMIAPGREAQNTGHRRASRIRLLRVPFFSDEASAVPFVTIMSLVGAAGWTVFARGLVNSHWFPGQQLPAWTPLAFATVILTTSLCSTLLYEQKGAKGLFLAAVFIGIVPLLAGAVIAAAHQDLDALTVWITTASPLLAPGNAVSTALPDALGNDTGLQLAAPRAFLFWRGLMILATVSLLVRQRSIKAGRATAVSE